MTPKSRSLSGAVLALVLIPIFAGILACMPVPVGDPERSRIDPELTGVWAVLQSEGSGSEAIFYIFEPYDKRTWLVTGGAMGAGEDSDLSNYDLTSYSGFAGLAAAEPVDENSIYLDEMIVYKAWLKKLGSEVFMTWEPKIYLDDGIAVPDVWMVYRVEKDGRDRIRMHLLDGDSDLFDDVKKTRQAYEKVIRKNALNPELYGYPEEDDDAAFITFARVQESEMDFFEDLVEMIVDWN